MISAKGKLVLDLDGDGKISGVKRQGAEVLVKANNLVLESLQDIIEERMRGTSFNIGISSKDSASFGASIQSGNRDAAWANAIGSIIGTEVTKIVIQQTLEIAGGLIANAEVDASGNLTDKGNASVQAGSIIVKHLHDYDNGMSLNLGLALSRSLDEKGDIKMGVSVPIAYSFHERARDILPVIGAGGLDVATLAGRV